MRLVVARGARPAADGPRNGDRSVFAVPTRFIPPPLLKHFDRLAWPEAQAQPALVHSEGPRVDLAARMRAMWR